MLRGLLHAALGNKKYRLTPYNPLFLIEKISRNISAYPVHDSLIVPASKAVIARDALELCFLKTTGLHPRVF